MLRLEKLPETLCFPFENEPRPIMLKTFSRFFPIPQPRDNPCPRPTEQLDCIPPSPDDIGSGPCPAAAWVTCRARCPPAGRRIRRTDAINGCETPVRGRGCGWCGWMSKIDRETSRRFTAAALTPLTAAPLRPTPPARRPPLRPFLGKPPPPAPPRRRGRDRRRRRRAGAAVRARQSRGKADGASLRRVRRDPGSTRGPYHFRVPAPAAGGCWPCGGPAPRDLRARPGRTAAPGPTRCLRAPRPSRLQPARRRRSRRAGGSVGGVLAQTHRGRDRPPLGRRVHLIYSGGGAAPAPAVLPLGNIPGPRRGYRAAMGQGRACRGQGRSVGTDRDALAVPRPERPEWRPLRCVWPQVWPPAGKGAPH